MATVYLAKSRGTGGFERYVAIKLTHPHLEQASDGDFMADLLEEAKLAVRIKHPNIVPAIDVGEAGRSLFLVMDYVEGDSLSGLVRKARRSEEELPLGLTMRILCDALAGLHAAHELRDEEGRQLEVVHRDVSPQNILVGVDGMARLADFGIARAASRISQTRPGSVKGKVGYMAPEQLQGKELDRRCDVWAAGVIAWELVAKQRLFEGKDDMAVALHLVTEPLPDIAAARPDVPPALAQAIRCALTKERAERTPTAAAFRASLLEACKISGLALFDHDEVGAVVERLTRPMLDERHREAKLVVQTRRASLPEGPPSRPSSRASGSALGRPTFVEAVDFDAGAVADRAGNVEAEPTQKTDTSAVREAPPRSRDGRLLALAGLALGTVAVGALLGAVLASRDRRETAASAAERPLSEPARDSSATTTTLEVAPSTESSAPESSARYAEPAPTTIVTSASAIRSGSPTATGSQLPSAGPRRPKGPPAPLAKSPYGPKR
jgi:serine/threonine-protein kinase